MSKDMKWTPEQLDAIRARRGTLLVSAAAGSGKTAVLVERVIERLTDPEHPTPADRLLIVTFTKAATSEMRTRLTAALDQLLREDPENQNLQKQKMLLPSAKICTIDSFCGALVRENFDQLGISPDFRMLDESESDILQRQAVSSVVSDYYEDQKDQAYRDLCNLLVTGRDDSVIEDNILKLYTYSRSYPSPSTWLHQSLKEYDADHLETSPIVQSILSSVLSMLSYLEKKVEQVLKDMEAQPDLSGTAPVDLYKEDRKRIQDIREAVLQYDFAEAVDLGNKDSHPYSKWKKPYTKKTQDQFSEDSITLVEYAKNVRNDIVKNALTTTLPKMLPATLEETREDCQNLRPLAEKLVEAVEKLDSSYRALKLEENALDFSDVELLALQLLTEDPGAEHPVFTDFAAEISRQYDEILIDECQDINRAQDLIFRAISRDENNLFMVGDVKQSIYRFRQASPELFLQRQETYPLYDREKDEYPAKVILGKNFRSRKGVLDTVNFVFGQLMTKEVGDLDYTDEEKLYFGNTGYRPVDRPDTEVHLFQPGRTENTLEREADYAARYILSEMEQSKDSDQPLEFRDFAILMASPKNTADTYRKVFSQYGIPLYSDTNGGFLDTADVQEILSLLRVIDNPLQDVPILAVMMSPLYGFTADEMSEIRVSHPHDSIYSAVLTAAQNGDQKCDSFLDSLRRYRSHSVSMPAGDLLREIFEETAFLSIVQAMPNGDQRVANLHLLLNYADKYDSFSFYGLSGFIRYLDRMAENNINPSAAATLSPNADVVRIMSIHKSKGLQFKICILANIGKKFNDIDQRQPMVLHPELGIGLKGRDPKTGNTFPTLFHTAICEEVQKRSRSESLRLLYVAMTRAEERLVILGGIQFLDTRIQKNAQALLPGKRIPPYLVQTASCFSDWLLLSLLRLPDAISLRNTLDFPVDTLPDSTDIAFHVDLNPAPAEETEVEELNEFQPTAHTEALIQDISSRVRYVYPWKTLSQTASKRTASQAGEEQEFSTRNFAHARPDFLSHGGLTPAERGTALHKYMQYADFTTAESDPEQELKRMTDAGLLSEEESKVIPLSKVQKFFQSALYRRMKSSPEIMREKQFNISIPAGYFNSDLQGEPAKAPTLMQGIVDAAFVEDGKLVVLDYKTDHVKSGEELAELYTDQLHIYAYAMHEITGMEVSGLILYSFGLGKQVDLPL